jgi:hypothetical protein
MQDGFADYILYGLVEGMMIANTTGATPLVTKSESRCPSLDGANRASHESATSPEAPSRV